MLMETFTEITRRGKRGELTGQDKNLILGEIRSAAMELGELLEGYTEPDDRIALKGPASLYPPAIDLFMWLEHLPRPDAQRAMVLITGTQGVRWLPLCTIFEMIRSRRYSIELNIDRVLKLPAPTRRTRLHNVGRLIRMLCTQETRLDHRTPAHAQTCYLSWSEGGLEEHHTVIDSCIAFLKTSDEDLARWQEAVKTRRRSLQASNQWKAESVLI